MYVIPPAIHATSNGPIHSYDAHGVFSSPRALYMFRSFGHKRSSILDGGLSGWLAHGQDIEDATPAKVSSTDYQAPALAEGAVKSKHIVNNSE